LQREGVECAYAPYELGFENYIRKHGWMFDIVLVYRVSVVDRVLDLVRTHAPQAVFLFHVADLHYLRMERTARLNDDAELLEAASLMKQRELGLMAQVDCTITHSEYERDLLAEEVPGVPVTVWPLMFDFFGTEQGYDARHDVVFLGGYRHPPNVDAVLYFAREILPLLLAKKPSLRFIIAGANPPDEVLALAGPNVVVTGMVDDLRTVFDSARVFVCPLRVGAGTKGKIISALSYGIPIVSTPTGVEGTSLREEVEVLVAENPASFAAATLRLYDDAVLWDRLSRNGQIIVRDTLSAGMGVKALGEAIEKGLAKKLGVLA
jgi:glycosyltransferase involved in cell wall biosynthesis